MYRCNVCMYVYYLSIYPTYCTFLRTKNELHTMNDCVVRRAVCTFTKCTTYLSIISLPSLVCHHSEVVFDLGPTYG